jgi:hypothetical protein
VSGLQIGKQDKTGALKYVGTKKPAAKSCRRISGELFHNPLSVAHPLSSTLLLLKIRSPIRQYVAVISALTALPDCLAVPTTHARGG